MIYGMNGMLRRNDFKWIDNPEALELLRSSWAAGDSCTTIADKLNAMFHVGLTRNAVIGKIHRLGLSAECPIKDPHTNSLPKKRKYRRAPWAEGLPVYSGGRRPKKLELTELAPETSANPVGIFELTDIHCRWPISGVGYQTMFCGDQAAKAYPYCPHHCEMAYRTVSQMRAESDAHKKNNGAVGTVPFIIRSTHIT